MTETDLTRTEIIETYYEILQSGPERFDPERLRAILAPDLVFEGPIAGHRTGAEPFLKGVAGFVTTLGQLEMLQLLVTDGQAAALYDAELPVAPCASPSSSSSTRPRSPPYDCSSTPPSTEAGVAAKPITPDFELVVGEAHGEGAFG